MKEIRRVAVVHDWLTGMRGGEVVLEAILDLFPEAELFTLLHNRGSVSEKISGRPLHTTFVDRLPFKKSRYRHYLPLFPTAIETFDFHGFDLVVSSSHCVAKGVLVPPGVPHICFVHSPMRYVWDMYRDYFPPKGFINRFIVPPIANYLRLWDAASAPRADRYVCNSAFVAERLRRFYGREAGVVPPPSLTEEEISVTPAGKREEFYLVVSALVPYKRIDLALEAFRGTDRTLVVVGEGPERKGLMRKAPPNVEFRGSVSREEILDLYGKARALLFPGLEDFGIVPLEAQARGCPVIAYGAGGALETVREGKTGLFFHDQTAEDLREALLRFESMGEFKKGEFEKNVRNFTDEKFKERFLNEIRQLIAGYGLSLPGDSPSRKTEPGKRRN